MLLKFVRLVIGHGIRFSWAITILFVVDLLIAKHFGLLIYEMARGRTSRVSVIFKVCFIVFAQFVDRVVLYVTFNISLQDFLQLKSPLIRFNQIVLSTNRLNVMSYFQQFCISKLASIVNDWNTVPQIY